MDFATIIGILSGLFLIVYNIVSGGDAGIFIHIPSMMIVFGGAMAATLVNFPLSEVVGVMSVVRKAFKKEEFPQIETVDLFVKLSKKSRLSGILAIDNDLQKIDDEFIRTGLELAVDGTDSEVIKDVMESEITYLIERHKMGQKIFTSLGTYAPAFGMIGTLIGLISMLKSMDDPSNIGMGMAVALITTFYGSLISNLVFLPIAGKLKNLSDKEIVKLEMIVEGVIAIQTGEHPRSIQKKLLNFISPKLRRIVLEKTGAIERE